MSPKCYACGGLGNKSCQTCKGTGKATPRGSGEGKKDQKKLTCPSCHGTGRVNCHVCGGTGRR